MSRLRLRTLPLYLRAPIAVFVIVGLCGYAAGLAFVAYNTGMGSQGISDHYHGNEDRLKFGKSTAEMLEIVHTHLLGMGLLFFVIALLFACTDLTSRSKTVWSTETLASLLTTFGSLWLVALGQEWLVWLMYPSSILMVAGYGVMSVSVFYHCLTPRPGTGDCNANNPSF